MSFDNSPPPPSNPHTYEESLVELPQRRLPQLSLRFLIGLTTLCAVLFTMIKLALGGNRFAQVAALLLCLAIGTLVSFAATYTVGMMLTDRIWRSKRTPHLPQGRERPSQSFDKDIGLVLLIVAATCASVTDLSAEINWQNSNATPTVYDFELLVGMESMLGPGGYRTIHLLFTPSNQTFSQEHQLELTISSHCNNKANLAAATSATFVLHQGDGKTEHTLLVPTFGTTDEFRLALIEYGQQLTEDRVLARLGSSNGDQYMDQAVTIGIWNPPLLGNQSMFPDVRSIVTVFGNSPSVAAPLPQNANEHRLSSEDSLRLASGLQPAFIQFRVFDELSLHPNWLALSDLDVMLVHQDFWSNVSVDEASRESLLRWVASGGCLWTYGDASAKTVFPAGLGVSATFADLPAAHVLDRKQLTNQLGLDEANDTSTLQEQWNGAPVKKGGTNSGNAVVFDVRADVLQELEAASNLIAGIEPAKDIAARVHVAEYGLGRIVVINGADPFPGSLQFWTAIRDWSQARDGPLGWIERYGLDYRAGNTNYWRWLIDSVGGPPVRSFLLLNTFFMLFVGPLAYFVLRRLDKLYLLYFVAPLAALLISGGLFAFAIISDGLGTKLRIHQWVWIDTVNKVEIQQDRSTYYSALGGGELRFPSDALVSVVMPVTAIDYSRYTGTDRYPGGRVKWLEQGQVWSRDFLPARSQIQYQVTRPMIQTPPQLTFAIAMDGSQVLTVTNHSNAAIGPLAYRDANGDYYRVDDVEPGQSQSMHASKQQEVRALIDDRLLPPAGFVPDVQSGMASYYTSFSPTDQTPTLERRLEIWRQELPKASFVGITQCDASRFAIENPEVSASLQIIFGRTE